MIIGDIQMVMLNEAAAQLGLPYENLRYYLRKKRVPGAIFKQRRWYIPVDTLEHWKKQDKRTKAWKEAHQ